MNIAKTSDHILIVDDDREIRELLSTYLVKNGLRVVTVPTGRHMRAALEESGPFDLIILDLMLPGEDGLTLCRDLRTGKYKATPILMLTARSEEADRILGLEMGADDYLAKPFSARELLARIRSVLRRTRMLPPNMRSTESASKLAFGDWQVDTTARNLIDNALKFGTDVRLQVHASADAGGNRLTLAVIDNGPGIPPDQLENVLKPFYRVEGSRNRNTGGTGLGLAIAQQLATAMGAELTLRNRDQGGLEARLTMNTNTAAPPD